MKKLLKNDLISIAFFLLYSLIFLLSPVFSHEMPLSVILLSYFAVFVFTFLRKIKTSYFLVIQVFTFFAELLGTGFSFYKIFPPYDLFLHFLSGILLVVFGLYIYEGLEKEKGGYTKALFAFFFSIAGAGAWEVWEYLGDLIFSLESQGSLKDTMEDIIAGSFGGLVCFFILIYLNFKETKNSRETKA